MICHYINLADAHERRAHLEEAFQRLNPPNWSLARFDAVDIHSVSKIPGRLSDAEKACFCSHRNLIEKYHETGDPLYIVEDDVEFSSMTFGVIDSILETNAEWDIIFTDVIVADILTMITLFHQRMAYDANQKIAVNSLEKVNFSATTSYLVNGRAKRKLVGLLRSADVLDRPYDIMLREFCHTGKLKLFYTFPFITSVSSNAEVSQIDVVRSKTDDDTIWRLFRRLMWVDRDMQACADAAKKLLDAACRDDAKIFATVVAASLSSQQTG